MTDDLDPRRTPQDLTTDRDDFELRQEEAIWVPEPLRSGYWDALADEHDRLRQLDAVADARRARAEKDEVPGGWTEWADALREDPGRLSEYYESRAWRRVKRERRDLDRARCCRCGASITDITLAERRAGRGLDWNPLHCHHITYERAGAERISDVRTLCKYCHAEWHARASISGDAPRPEGLGDVKPGDIWVAPTELGAHILWT